MDTVRVRAHESSDFRLKSTENQPKVLILQDFYGSGRRGRKFESCHLDQNQKRKARPSFFDFRLKIIDLSFSNAEHLIVLRPKRLRKMIHLGAKQGSESCHLDPKMRYGWLIPLYRISSLRPPVHNISFASQRSVLR